MANNVRSENGNLEYFARPLAVSVVLLVIWFLAMLVFTYFYYQGQQFLVVGDPFTIIEKTELSYSIVSMGKHSLSLHSTEPDFVAELYSAGAVAVLPFEQGTCISLSSAN